MKKTDLLRAICFSLVLILVLGALGRIYTPKTGGTGMDSKIFRSLPENSVDVLYSGASGIMADVAPTVIWDEYGITGYNISSSAQIALTTYYTFKGTLKKQNPKIFVLDAKGLINVCDVDNEYFGPFTRHVFDEMKMSDIKVEAIFDIASQSQNETVFNLLFPALRYHERTPEIRSVDFVRAFGYEEERDRLYLGHLFSAKTVQVEPMIPIDRTGVVSESDATVFNEVSSGNPEVIDVGAGNHMLDPNAVKYYEKIIELCGEKNIKVVLLKIPAPRWTMEDYDVISGFAQQHGIDYIDLNLYEYLDEISLDPDTDFKDFLHLNCFGAVKVSRVLGKKLAEDYNLGDHRGDEYYAGYERFSENFNSSFEESVLAAASAAEQDIVPSAALQSEEEMIVD